MSAYIQGEIRLAPVPSSGLFTVLLRAFLAMSLWLTLSVAAQASPLDDLLRQVQQSNQAETAIDQAALQAFQLELTSQQGKLAEQNKHNQQLRQQMTELQQQIGSNNTDIRRLQQIANREKIDLDKLFSEFQRASQDLSGQLKKTPVSALLPGRSAQLSPFSEADFTPDLAAMKQLWLLFTEQMVASSKVSTAQHSVIGVDGLERQLLVTQIGGFGAFTAQGPLLYQADSEGYLLLGDDNASINQRIAAFSQAKDGYISAMIDPSAGGLLQRAMATTPWWQSFADAGMVGGLIVIVALVGFAIAGTRLVVLRRQAQRITQLKSQLQSADKTAVIAVSDNALGRILAIAEQHPDSSAEELSRFLDEAILAELPECRKGLGSLAVLAAVAPMLGLLGTVAGMIETFQAITAYGNSDPQVLSSGISQALLTTKFGLLAAVPLMLMHSWLSSKSDALLHVIEHQSAGLLAQRQRYLQQHATAQDAG